MSDDIKISVRKALSCLAPVDRMSVSEWADKYRKLVPESSSEPGFWRTSRTPYLEEPMNVISKENARDVTCVFASQTGKSEIILNGIGAIIHLKPAPILTVLPTIEMAESWSDDRFAPMIEEIPELKEKFLDTQNKAKRNTKRHKKFKGGVLTIAGANSASSLSMRAIAHLRCDEVDRFPRSARGSTGKDEGDPIALASARISTYHDGTIVKVSSPTEEETSRIWHSYLETDQRKFYVPCPKCNTYQTLSFQNLVWNTENTTKVFYKCPFCNVEIKEGHKNGMLERGRWQPTSEKKFGKVGFWLSALYSPWVTWATLVSEYEEAKRSRKSDLMRVFVNTRLAEVWKDSVESFESMKLFIRRETYDADVPDGVLIITAGVDTQDDRLEVEVVGWGHDDESWGIDYRIFWGNPAKKEIWSDLDEYLQQKFTNKNRMEFKISCTCIDSRGHHNSTVWDFCKKRKSKNIYAIHGVGGENRAILGHAKRPVIGKHSRTGLVFPVGTFEAKTSIYSYLKLDTPGPAYCHFPIKDCYSEEYFKQLTSEVKKTVYKNGYPCKVWYLPDGRRNEALDCRVYALAALKIIKPDYKHIEKKLAVNNVENTQATGDTKQPAVTENSRIKRRPHRQGGRNVLLDDNSYGWSSYGRSWLR